MSKISNYFQQMNERFVPNWFDYVSAIFYLNENFPSWREEIRNPGEWQDAFSFRVHVYKGCNSEEFASRMFDAIQNDEALRFVWQNEGLNDFYRICAAKRLIALDKDRYYVCSLHGPKWPGYDDMTIPLSERKIPMMKVTYSVPKR